MISRSSEYNARMLKLRDEYVARQQALYHEFHATPDELAAILGPRWAIARKTPENIEKYGKCISRAEYEKAQAQALKVRRANGGG